MNQPPTRSTQCLMLLLAASLLLLFLWAPGATAAKAPKPFRCFRPFGALRAFKPAAMKGNENCIFDFMAIDHATVTPTCRGDAAGADRGCKVSIVVNATRQHRLLHGSDSARYTLELRSVNDSTIHYKGFDGNGYSVCCAMITTSFCEWEEHANASSAETSKPVPRRLVPRSCPAFDDDATTFQGVVEKPLHTYTVGPWDATLTFWRGHESVGRLVIPFTLSDADVAEMNITLDARPVTEEGGPALPVALSPSNEIENSEKVKEGPRDPVDDV